MARFSSYLPDWMQQIGLSWPRSYSKAYLQALAGQPGAINGRPWGHGPLVPPNVSVQNQINQYGPIPDLYGTFRYFPPYAGVPYTEYEGQKTYTRVLYMMGYGPMNMNQFWLGNKLLVPVGLSDTTVGHDNNHNLDIEVRYGFAGETPHTIYPRTVVQDSNAVTMTNAFSIKETPIPCNEANVGILFPNGLYQSQTSDSNSPIVGYGAGFEIDYAPTDSTGIPTGGWVSTAGIAAIAATKYPYQAGLRIKFPSLGLYLVRIKRTVAPAGPGSLIVDASQWTYLTAMENGDPTPPLHNVDGSVIPLATIAIRAEVKNGKSRTFDNFSVVAQRLLPVWTGSAWTTETTNNPAWAHVNQYAGPQNKKPIALSRFNTTDLLAWSIACDTLGFQYNKVHDSQQTAYQLAQQICTAGRAMPIYQNGKYSISFDTTVSGAPAQHFCPRNCANMAFQKNFLKLPQGLRIQWTNPNILYQQDEIEVFPDGYNGDGSNGLIQATSYDTYQLQGVTNTNQAWVLGRYYMAVGQYRQRIVTFDTDWESLLCNAGDLIRVGGDVLGIGSGQGLITAVQTDGSGNVTGFTIDDNITGDGVTQLTAMIRQSDNSEYQGTISVFSGAQSTFTLSTPIPHATSPLPVVGNLVMIGAPPSNDFIITKIETKQSPQLAATITCVDYNPAIFTSDTQTPPAYTSGQTFNPAFQNRPVPQPIVLNIASDSSVMIADSTGTKQPRILITLSTADHSVIEYEGFISPSGSNGQATPIPKVSALLGQISIQPVQVGQAYDITLTAISSLNSPSEDTTIVGYVVQGDTDQPQSTLSANVQNGILTWVDPAPASNLAGYIVKVIGGTIPNFASGSLLTPTPLTGAMQLDVSSSLNGVVTFMVAAISKSGVLGVPAYVTTDLGDPIVNNVVVTEDYVAAGYPGVISGGTVVSGVLKANSQTLFWATNPSALFWNSNPAALFWTADFDDMTYTFTFDVVSSELPATLTLTNTITGNYAITYSFVTFSNPFWNSNPAAPFWNSNPSALFWQGTTVVANQPWPAQGVAAQAGTYILTVETDAGAVQGTAPVLEAVLDVQDVVEKFTAITIAPGGTRLPLTSTFRVITAVGLTIFSSGTGGLTPVIDDHQTTLGAGPLIEVLNTSGTSVGGTVDATVEGY